MNLSNLPPGVTNNMIEEAAGAFDEDDKFTPDEVRRGIAPLLACGVECMTCSRLLGYTKDLLEQLPSDADRKLLRDIAATVANYYEGPESGAAMRRMGEFIDPLDRLIARIK